MTRYPMTRTRNYWAAAGLASLALIGMLLWRAGATKPSLPDGVDSAERAAAWSAQTSEPRTGVVQGTVRAASGVPVAGAAVILTPGARDDGGGGGVRELTGSRDPVTTSRDGRFVLEGVAPGAYALSAMARGHGPALQTGVRVEAGASVSVDLALGSRGVALGGRILEGLGTVVPRARVVALDLGMGEAEARRPERAVIVAFAGDDGRYELWLARSEYELRVLADGYLPARARVSLVQDQEKDIELIPAGRLEGFAREATSGSPVAGATVALLPIDGKRGVSRETSADDDGVFRFGDLEAGAYSLSASQGALVSAAVVASVAPAETTSGVELLLSRGLAISGRVLSVDGSSVRGASVTVDRAELPMERPVQARCADDGSFFVQPILPGRVHVRGDAPGHVRSGRIFTLFAENLAGVVIEIAAQAAVQGKVQDPEGAAVSGAEVQAWTEAERSSAQERAATLGRAVSGADGSFSIKGLRAGKLTVTAQHPLRGAGRLEKVIRAGDNGALVVTLAPAGSIAGTVKYEDGGVAEGIEVRASPRSSRTTTLPPAQKTDREGRFRLSPVEQGSFVVAARDIGREDGDSANQVVVALAPAEQKTAVQLLVRRRDQRVTGVVVDHERTPVPGATVAAVQAGTDRRRLPAGSAATAAVAVSEADGTFALEALGRGGAYELRASHPKYADARSAQVLAGATGVILALAAPAAIAGVATSEVGEPVSDFRITLAAQGTTALGDPASAIRRIHDPGGRYAFSGLPAGSYRLRVSALDGRTGEATTELLAGQRKQGLRIVVGQGATVTGKVLDLETGEPVVGATVTVVGPSEQLPTATDSQGSFRLLGVPGGKVGLGAGSPKHAREIREIEIPRGTNTVDVEVFRLVRAIHPDQFGDGQPATPGLSLQSDSNRDLIIQSVRAGSAAERAGLLEGDRVLAINGKDVRRLASTSANLLLFGKSGSSLELTIARAAGPPQVVTLTREARAERTR
jgi:large repetitive protein